MRYMTKKITAFFISLAILVNLGLMVSHGKPDWPSDTGIMAEAGIVIDADSGTVLFGQKIHVSFPPASITKLLTALVVAEHCSMDEIVIFSHDAIYDVESGSGNKLALEEGDQISVEDCLHLLLLLSSNQCANALAEHVAGSREAFVEMMNQKIAEIGCSESHFANPSGLNDENQYVSAYDMAFIAAEAFRNETVLRVSSTRRYRVGSTINNPEGANISMEHKILMAENSGSEFYCEGALAGKTGYTSIAGNTLVTYARRGDRNLISVILRGSQPQYYIDGKTILNFGFASFKNESIENQETFMREREEVEIEGTAYPMSRLRLDEAVVTLPADAEFADAERTLRTELPAGHPEGAVAMLEYTYNERKIGSAYIYDTELEAELAARTTGEAEETTGDINDGEVETGDQNIPDPEESGQEENRNVLSSGKGNFGLNSGQVLSMAAVLACAAAAGAVAFLIVRRKRQERLQREIRRERRRQRLSEIGCNEEEFEELLRRRMENSQNGKRDGKDGKN